AQGLVVFAIGLVLTSGSLAALGAASGSPSHGTELAVLIAANLAATVLRFLLFRAWVFPDRDRSGDASRPVDAPAHRPVDAPASRPADRPVDDPASRPADRPVDAPAPLPAAVTADDTHHELRNVQ
ncbi:glycosyl transferase, partial [Streptomyces sp. NPDC047939]